MTSRRYCFTSFDTTTKLTLDDVQDLRYSIYQVEAAPDTGRTHFQGYLHFSKPKRLAALKKIPGLEGAHFEVSRGSALDNRRYCSKPESRIEGPFETGDFDSLGPGTRNDIAALKEAVDSGKSDLELWDDFPATYLRYYRGITHVRLLKAPRRDFQTELHVLVGTTGLGKTTYVKDTSPGCFWKTRGDWWDGYSGSDDVCLDDFYGWIKYDELLRLANCVPYQVEIKGSTVNFAAKQIFITSNNTPASWYPNVGDISALFRRITTIMVFTEFKAFTLFRHDERGTAYDNFVNSKIL